MSPFQPYQKRVIETLMGPQKTSQKRAKVKAARKANIRRVQARRRSKQSSLISRLPKGFIDSFFRAYTDAILDEFSRLIGADWFPPGGPVGGPHWGPTVTGRWAGQGGPVDVAKGSVELKPILTAPSGGPLKAIVGGDYSKIERRVLAHMAHKR